jgi:3-oxoacyl-[acyl-carrier protein] reductase
MELEGRRAFVTGAGQGLGEAIAAELVRQGASVALADVDVAAATAAAERLGTERALALEVDVRDKGSVERAFAEALDRLGGMEVVVNNAARTVRRSVWDIEAGEWDDVLAVNLRGVLFCCQVAGPHLREHAGPRGRIVNLASLAGQAGGTVAGAHYAASKAGIVVLTKVLARELAPAGVTVNAVAPAAISGPAMDAMPADAIAALTATIPLGRVGDPRDVAALVALLAGDRGGFTTGATYDLNGGLLMR